MVVIGIILVLLGLLLGAFVVAGSLPGGPGTDVSFSLFGLTVETSAVVVFALGAVTLLLLELGVLALRSGARKSSKRRAELQRLRRVEAEVQARQASDSQRNAATTAAASPAAPAPFARRDAEPSPRPSTSHTEAGHDSDSTGSESTRIEQASPLTKDRTQDASDRAAFDASLDEGGSSAAPTSPRSPGTGSSSTDRA